MKTGQLVNYILIQPKVVSETEYDLDLDTDLPIDVFKKIILDIAAGLDEMTVTEVDEPMSTVPEDYN